MRSKVVGSSYYIPLGIWMAMYMEYQGYRVKQNQLMQDNMVTQKWIIMVKICVRGIPGT